MIANQKDVARKSRRDFLKKSGVLAAVSSFLISGTMASGHIIGANGRV